jgi:hypothetical protein
MTTMLRISAGASALALAFALTACGGSHGMLPSSATGQSPIGSDAVQAPLAADAADGVTPDAKAKIKITPAKLALLGTGASGVQSFTITEANYKGKFKAESTCSKVATLKPTAAKGPKTTIKVTPKKAGTCTITFSDTAKNSAKLSINDTTATVGLDALSISPNSVSVRVVLTTVNGVPPKAGVATAAITALPSTCQTAGCTVAAPQSPAGNDAYALTIYDGANASGNILATGTASAAIAAGKANVITAPQLSKVPAFLVFSGLATANAGTTFTHSLTLSVQDADHAAIIGTYSTPITVTDADTSAIAQGTSISLNGAAASRSATLARSSDTMTFTYGGLAIPAVTVTASATGATNGSVTFTATLQPIVFTDPDTNNTPEIDLYNPATGSPGNSGTFSLTQPGWAGSPYGKNFTYALAGTGLPSTTTNCSSYTVTPASGTATSFTVSVGASSVAGSCTMTLTGAPGTATQAVVLTYSTGSIGVSGKHHKP